jgi:hypothetical protein
VDALFYNFAPGEVARHIPKVWRTTTPEAAIAARQLGCVKALRRILGDRVDTPAFARAAELLMKAATSAPFEGRPMYAALRAIPIPDDVVARLFHAASLLREHRGDGHIALLVDAGLSGIDALVTATATGTGFVPPFARASRGWTEDEWAACEVSLRERGLLGDGLSLTPEGNALRERIEDDTNRLGAAPWEALGEEGTARLGELGRPLVRGLLKAGCFPAEGVFATRR